MIVTIYIFHGVMTYTYIYSKPIFVRNRFARLVLGVANSPLLFNAVIHKHFEKYEFTADLYRNIWSPSMWMNFQGELILSMKFLIYLKSSRYVFLKACLICENGD